MFNIQNLCFSGSTLTQRTKTHISIVSPLITMSYLDNVLSDTLAFPSKIQYKQTKNHKNIYCQSENGGAPVTHTTHIKKFISEIPSKICRPSNTLFRSLSQCKRLIQHMKDGLKCACVSQWHQKWQIFI